MKIIKKIMIVLLMAITSSSFAQVKATRKLERSIVKPGEGRSGDATSGRGGSEWTNNYPQTCFCCDGVYNLQTAVSIKGPETIDCFKPTVFSIENCKGTTVTWTVSPTIPFTGQGTNTIAISPPYSDTSYTVSVSLRCGEKTVNGSRKINLNLPANITPAFTTTLTQLSNGNWNIDAVPTTKAGVDHYWGLVGNGAYPNCIDPCVSMPLANITGSLTFGCQNVNGVFSPVGMGTAITGGTTGFGYNYSGLGNACYKITHYVKVCGITYKQTQCFSLSPPSNLKVANGTIIKPTITVGEIEIVK